MNENKLLTANEVAKELRLPKHRVYELTRRKLIPFVQIGERQYRYSAEALKEWIANGGNRQDDSLCDAA